MTGEPGEDVPDGAVVFAEVSATSHEEERRIAFRRAYPGEIAMLECAWLGRQPAMVQRLTLHGQSLEVLRNEGGDLYPLATGAAATRPDLLPAALGSALRQRITDPAAPDWQVFIPPDDRWADWLSAVFGSAIERQARRYYAGNPAASVSAQPAGTRAVDEDLAARLHDSYGDDIFAAWGEAGRFLTHGFGAVALDPEDRSRPVSVCLSYSVGGGVAEIDIVTEKAHRQQGHGHRAALAFLYQCAERDLRPSWSCYESNAASKALAERLGFRAAAPYWWMPVRRRDR